MVAVPSEGPIAAWQRQYQMPDDKLAGSRPELKGLYRYPQPHDTSSCLNRTTATR
jgi:hypothetical protein